MAFKCEAEEPCILKEPTPFVGVAKLGESSVDVVVQMWVQRADVRQVRSGFLEKIKFAFDQHGIHLPYPQRTIHLQNSTDPMRQHVGVEHE